VSFKTTQGISRSLTGVPLSQMPHGVLRSVCIPPTTLKKILGFSVDAKGINLICLLHCHFLSWVAHHNQQTPNSLKDLMSGLVSQIKRTSIRDKANNEIL
jgi:hypothetical protein